LNKQYGKLEGKLERKKIKEILQETKKGEIQWKESEPGQTGTFESSFVAEWEGKKLRLSRWTDWDSITITTSDYKLVISEGKTSIVIYGGTISFLFIIPVYSSRRTIGLLQDLYYFIERQEELNRRKKEEIERLKNIEALKSL